MPDREKVIKGLEVCVDRVPGKYTCNKCPYETDGNDCEINLTKDAAALLKEQEANPQRYKENDIFLIPICPNTECNAVMNQYWHYCPYCGTRFAWDEELDKLQRLIAEAKGAK